MVVRRRTLRTELASFALLAAVATACGGADPPHLAVTALPAATDSRAAAFELRNEGGRMLTLDGVVAGCGCVAGSRLPPELAPGAATRLDVRCSASRLAGDGERELRVRSSDARRPETLLRVALGPSSAAPAPLYLGYVAVGATLVRDVVVASDATVPPTASRPDLEVDALAPNPDGVRSVRVRYTPRVAGIVRTTVDLGPAGMLPITAVAYERVMAYPAEVRVPRPSGAAGLGGVTLVVATDSPLAIARVDYPAGITGELRTIEPGRQYRLVLHGRGPIAGSDAAIRVHGDAGADPLLVIPVVDAAAAEARPHV